MSLVWQCKKCGFDLKITRDGNKKARTITDVYKGGKKMPLLCSSCRKETNLSKIEKENRKLRKALRKAREYVSGYKRPTERALKAIDKALEEK